MLQVHAQWGPTGSTAPTTRGPGGQAVKSCPLAPACSSRASGCLTFGGQGSQLCGPACSSRARMGRDSRALRRRCHCSCCAGATSAAGHTLPSDRSPTNPVACKAWDASPRASGQSMTAVWGARHAARQASRCAADVRVPARASPAAVLPHAAWGRGVLLQAARRRRWLLGPAGSGGRRGSPG